MCSGTSHFESASCDLLTRAALLQEQHQALTPVARRKERGQYFTPASIARFMAQLFSTPRATLRVLDAGAGAGILSAAVCGRILDLRSPRLVEFVLFETDPAVLPALEENMRNCCIALRRAGHEMRYAVRQSDFILSNQSACGQGLLFGEADTCAEFDLAIMNPPYFKLSKQSAHARAFEQIVHGQPNMYALFMATAASLLRTGGELVAITPRSFCSGAYFREFRRWFLKRMTLKHLHLFDSRADAFRGAEVLQESVITRFDKLPGASRTIRLSTSHGADLHGAEHVTEYPTRHIIDENGGSLVIRIPASQADALIMKAIESWPARFVDHGLQISTGPVVAFRAAEHLLQDADRPNSVPLLSQHNVRAFETRWPLRRKGKPLALRVSSRSAKLLLPSRNYVLLRRFSAKEEHRRLTASPFLPHRGGWPPKIAIENHVNYVYHMRRELTDLETLGLTALLNSAVLDRYFRSMSGNTQVNATEIRAMPFPPLPTLASLGSIVERLGTTDRDAVDTAVLEALGIDGRIARRLQEIAL